MKLTPINNKLENSIWDSIRLDARNKTSNSASWEVYWKINNEIWNPNLESISWMQQRTLRNLQNSSK